MKPRVSIVRVESDDIEAAVKEAVHILGGIDRFVEPKGRYLIKPNLFMNKTAEEGATTDARIVMALAKMLKSSGAKPVVGECPAMASYTRPDIVFDGLGIRQLCEKAGVELNVLDRELPVKVENSKAEVVKDFWFPKFALMCDGIINVPKLKTHGLTTLTCAVKNFFGLQQGGTKANHHVRTRNDPERFSRLLIDLYECIYERVRLNVVDSVIGMEGEGPTTGDPVEVNLIIAGKDAVAVDLVASAVIGWNPMEVGTNLVALERGLGPASLEEIEVVGVPVEEVVYHFKRPQTCKPGQVFRDVRMPIVCDEKKCAGCGICAEICPVNAIIFDGTPEFDDERCIQCFCCMELCSHGALRAVRKES
jgi:uncharacterized protein (DUF362 family)